MAKSAKKTTNATTSGNAKQDKALNILKASLGKLNTSYGDVAKLENMVQIELVIFYSKYNVQPKSKEARALNATAKATLREFCPNMSAGTIQLFIKCAQSPISMEKLNIKDGTTSATNVLKQFDKAPDSTNDKGKKLSVTGYIRRALPKGKKVTKVTPKGGVTFTVSDEAKGIMILLEDNIADALTQSGCKVLDDEIVTLKLKICKAFDEHIVDIKQQA